MATFRPSARVRLQIRLEEYDDTAALDRQLDRPAPTEGQVNPGARPGAQGEATADVDQQLERVQQSLSELIGRRETIPSEELAAERAQLERQRTQLQRQQEQAGRTAPEQQPPEALGGSPPDDRVILGQIQPRQITVDRNGIRQADTCSITLNHSDAPIDPRAIRACGVEITLGSVSPELYEDGLLRGATGPDGMLRSIVPRDSGSGDLNTTTRFVGWMDDWTVDLDGEDGDSVQLTCRDMTSLLIDTPLPSGSAIDLTEPIVRGVSTLLESISTTRGWRVVFGAPGSGENDDLGPVPGEALQSVRRARRGRVARRARRGNRMSLWDHITDTTVQLGLVPLIVGYDLHLIRPRTFYADSSRAIKMIYGRNLSHLSMSRKFGGVKVPTIQVRCYDGSIGRTRWAQHPVSPGAQASGIFGQDAPPRPTRANQPGVSGANAADRIQTINVTGISDPQQLQRIAESTFEQIGRQEIEGSFATDDISSFEGPEGDLLDLNAGDAVEILTVAPGTDDQGLNEEGAATAQQIQAMSRQRRADYLVGLGWRRQVAEQLAAAQDAVGFQTIFRVQNVRLSYDVDDGISTEVDFINFVEVRELSRSTSDDRAENEPPSPQANEATAARTEPAAENLREASSERRNLTRDREAGRLTEAEYQEGMDGALERERLAARRFRGG